MNSMDICAYEIWMIAKVLSRIPEFMPILSVLLYQDGEQKSEESSKVMMLYERISYGCV
jgi:hypothetical protein